ncbi:MAG TPA: hypothetical protein VKT99_16180, partial [Xanthobacteraceae bacterium]|nr:hypothetical protein [Xanthobacteraceae bacterium]
RRQPVKGLDRLSGDWRAIKRAPIALDRLPPPARLHPSDQGPRQGRAPQASAPTQDSKEAKFPQNRENNREFRKSEAIPALLLIS